MSTYEDNYLAHFGIKGQKWGIRRYQNEDGSLTEEGKARYLDSLTDRQRKIFAKMPDRNRRSMEKKLSQGKSWNQSIQEINQEAQRKGLAIGAALTAAALYIHPETRWLMKAAGRSIAKAGKTVLTTVKSTKTAQKGSLYIKQLLKRRTMMKNGAVSLKKSQFSVKDYVPKFGGYLN